MKALVLGGGSIKGSYQAGAIRALLASGYVPDIVTGISVGALNAAYLAAYQIETDRPTSDDWWFVGDMLADFWRRQVTGPARFVRKRGVLDLAWRWLRRDWGGLVSTDPLAAVVRRTFAGQFPARGPLICRVGAVNLRTGALEYHSPDAPDFLDAVLASTAEPITMPTRPLGGVPHVDGGVRDITPLAEAIRLGATRIVCVVCQPAELPAVSGPWGDVAKQLTRCLSIVENEIVANDLRTCERVNRMVAAGVAPEKRHVEVTVIRPSAELAISLTDFGPADIARMVAQGEVDAQAALAVNAAA